MSFQRLLKGRPLETKQEIEDYTLHGAGKFEIDARFSDGSKGYLVVQITDRDEVNRWGTRRIKFYSTLYRENGQPYDRPWYEAEDMDLAGFVAYIKENNGRVHWTVGA